MGRRRPEYRSGLVLGFSVAESFLLIVFVLILLLSLLIARKTKAEKDLQILIAQQEVYEGLREKVKEAIGKDDSAIDDYFKELSDEVSRAREMQSKLEESSAELESYKELKETLLSKEGVDPDASAEKLTDLMREAIDARDFSENDPQSPEHLESNLRICKGQVENLQRKLVDEGKGFAYPPCLVDSAGKPEYLYDVAVTSKGVLVKPSALRPTLNRDHIQIMKDMVLEKEVSTNVFGRGALPIFNYSKKNNCRFFVRLFDNTKPTEKITYKKHRRHIEGYFYILDKKDQRLR